MAQQPARVRTTPVVPTTAGWVLAIIATLIALSIGGRSVAFAVPILLAIGTVFAVDLWSGRRALRNVEIKCLRSDSDLYAGDPLKITIDVRGVSTPLLIEQPSPDRNDPGVRVDEDVEGELASLPVRRGAYDVRPVVVRSTSLFGLLHLQRMLPVHLPGPVFAWPRPEACTIDWTPILERGTGAATMLHSFETQNPRGIREYADGDPLSRVHWAATAHTGTLMVRELDREAHHEIDVIVSLTGPGPASQHALQHAMWIGLEVLARGWDLRLTTVERAADTLGMRMVEPPPGTSIPTKTVTRRVVDRTDLGRRLARALEEVPEPPPTGRPRLLVSGVGVVWDKR